MTFETQTRHVRPFIAFGLSVYFFVDLGLDINSLVIYKRECDICNNITENADNTECPSDPQLPCTAFIAGLSALFIPSVIVAIYALIKV